MATSLNGYIAKKNNETPWSESEWKSYSKIVKSIGNIIIRWNTYKIMKESDEFNSINNPLTIILTNQKLPPKNNFIFVNSPTKALDILKEKGFKKVLISGGKKLNTSFLKKNLIDEIYIDVEPFIFGKGIKLFSEVAIYKNLELLETKLLSKNSIQLHYKVSKD